METISRSLLTFLLNSLWQTALVGAIAALACRLLRKSPASQCHTIWVAALAAAFLLPATSVRRAVPLDGPPVLVDLDSPAGPLPLPSRTSAAPQPAAPTPKPVSRTISLATTTSEIVLGAYLLFILIRFAGLLRASFQTLRLRRTAYSATLSPPLERVLRRAREEFATARVALLFSSRVSGPVTAGRAIILPEALRAETSDDVLTTVIGHEMAHIARRDFACNFVYELLALPISFHPAVWMMRGGLERTREMACDEMVTESLMQADAYARSMLRIATAMTLLPRPGYTLGVFDGNILEERIRRLIERPAAHWHNARLSLVGGLAALGLCAILASSLSLTARAQGPAGENIRNGQTAYAAGDYKSAAANFETAVKLEPNNIEGKLLLAKSLMKQYVPGPGQFDLTQSPFLAEARRQYLDVLAREPQNKLANHGMMVLTFDTREFAASYQFALKTIQADSSDATAYYTAGVIDWNQTYPDVMKARKAAGMEPQDPGIILDAGLRQSVRAQHMSQVEEGLRMLQTALQINPDYADAMAYTNLLYRIEACLADTNAEYSELIATADGWVTKTLATIHKNSRNAAQSGQSQTSERADAPLMAPPPPPPPPPPGNGELPPGQVSVSPSEQQARLVKQVAAVYPDLARQAHISGSVNFNVLIAKDGTMRNIRVVSGHPMLVAAALQAVKQWVYEPLLINGSPVEVVTTVTVNFAPQ